MLTADHLAPILAAVRAAPPRCGPVEVVCIDGPAGSGKTTVANALALALAGAGATPEVPVVHMDDLYEGWGQVLGQPLGLRIEGWLLDPWAAGRAGRHPRYDWVAGRFADWVDVPAAPVVILEGCGSASQVIRERAALVVWVEAPADLRLTRGLARDGAPMEAQWRAWQAHEAAHFAADGTRAAADLLVDGTTGGVVAG